MRGNHGGSAACARASVTWLLVIAGVAAFGWRMVGLENAPFLLDEPQFLMAAQDQLITGEWQTHSTLLGSSGIYYGAAAIWFYSLVQVALGPSPFVAIAAMGTLLSAAQIFFCVALTRALQRDPEAGWWSVLGPDGRLFLGSVLLLLASSPHQHYWSRLAWDTIPDAAAFAVMGILLHLHSGRWFGTAATGAMLGYGLTSHPMLGPFAAVTSTAIVLRDGPRSGRLIASRVIALAVPAGIVMLPWLLSLAITPRYEGVSGRGTGLTLEWMLEAFRAPGTAGVEHFFDAEWDAFASSASSLPGLDLLLVASPVLWVGLGLGGLILGARGARPRVRQLALCGVANLFLYPVFYVVRGAQVQPHYQFPTGWIAVAGVAVLLAASNPRIRRATVSLTLALAVGQLLFIASWRDWIDDRGGTRGVNYAVPLGEQARTVEEVCETATGPVVVSLDVVAFPVSFEYLTATSSVCAEDVRWCPPRSDCARPRPGEQPILVRYAESAGAHLEVIKDGRDTD